MIKNAKICVTGGAGFIGSMLVSRLIEENEIIIFDNFSRNSIANKACVTHKNLHIIKGDVCNFKDVFEATKDCDYIIHCAGICGIDTCCKIPTKTLHVNIIGSYNVLESAKKHNIAKRVISFSTSEVFGGMALSPSELDRTVIGAVGEARWTYAVSKLAEEHMAIAYYKEFGVPSTVLRPFNVYGPGQIGEGALKIFIQHALKNEPITIYGDGTQIRAWCYVTDMVDATLLCLENPNAIGESFNIGNNRSIETIYGLAKTVIRILNSKSNIVFSPALSADIELRIPCIKKAKEMLGFEAQVDLEKGIMLTANTYDEKRG